MLTGIVKRPSRKRSFEVDLIELIRPDGWWPSPYSLEQAFELLRHFVATGAAYSPSHTWNVVSLLSGSSGYGLGSVNRITSIDDLRRRFHWAILGRAETGTVAQWRADHGIGPTARIRVPHPVYRPFKGAEHLGWRSEREIQNEFEGMSLKAAGTEMAVSMNSVHPGCRTLHGLSVKLDATSFYFVQSYGDKPPGEFGSRWDDTIARTRPGESFLDTFARARDVFDVLVHGKRQACDLGDLQKFYRPDFVLDQVARLTGTGEVRAPASEAPPC